MLLFSVKYSKIGPDDEYRIKIENETFDGSVVERPSCFISSEIATRKMFFPFERFSQLDSFFLAREKEFPRNNFKK